MKAFWNERYAAPEFAYGTQPNEFFREQLETLRPGALLLPCEGEGRNAVYAAAKGWTVTAFDQSETGRDKCLRLANEQDVAVDYRVADAGTFDYGENRYDAIALIFAHFPLHLRAFVHQQCMRALKAGGVLLLEAFTPAQLQYQSGGPREEQLLYTTDLLRDDFAAASQITAEETFVTLQEGPFHQGTAAVVRLVARK
ncbi:MAG TPA: class I SAM-dependent methyltransferase [Lacibacter sp.]|nr:class I SAM-dependent methyltransferase [Lacibacter sp.]HMO87862.1 class I SAM-dependent methyltransferase [Lacibacter sp.]HMP85951.1 class I SAM-dependent methyltransferase [Lacibacter sp.]